MNTNTSGPPFNSHDGRGQEFDSGLRGQEFSTDSSFQTESPALNNQQRLGGPQTPANHPLELSKSITQEDLMFMRKWQQDSMIYRG